MSLLRAAAIATVLLVPALSLACQKKEGAEQKPETKTETTSAFAAPAAVQGSGPIAITVGEDGFKPNNVKVKKGDKTTLVFTRTTDETCATEVVFPQLNIKKELPKGKPVSIELPTDKEQTLAFQCGMGMYKSAVVVSAN